MLLTHAGRQNGLTAFVKGLASHGKHGIKRRTSLLVLEECRAGGLRSIGSAIGAVISQCISNLGSYHSKNINQDGIQHPTNGYRTMDSTSTNPHFKHICMDNPKHTPFD